MRDNAALYRQYFGDRPISEQAQLFPTCQGMIEYVLDPVTEHEPTDRAAKVSVAEHIWAYIQDNKEARS